MYARAIDDAGHRLHELRCEEWSDLALGAAALIAALLATQVRPAFALPLFFGSLFVGVRGLRAAWRRWDIVDELAGEPDAYVIDEIRTHALRETTIERRRLFAAYIRLVLHAGEQRLDAAASDLEALADELEDEALALDPAHAVACARLVGDPCRSSLLNHSATSDEVIAQVEHIRGGFARRDST
jgi:hypothetical protein